MNKIAQHKILVSGDSYENCCQQVHKFFALTSLVIYDCIQIIDEQSCSALDADFFETISKAEEKNRESVRSLVEELRQAGANTVTDLQHLEHGYPSKVLHVLSHFLDGFIGIDSFFYNLLDDSHWLPDKTSTAIMAEKNKYWLVHIDCYSATPKEAALLHM